MEANNATPLQTSNRQLTIAFFVAYIIGAASVGLSSFAPCIPLLGYAALGFFLTRDQRNLDRFADSLYYLGFLLTLTALFLALWQLSKQGEVLEIVNALGAGLSASIVGLGLRVLVVQFRGTVSDQEEETRQSIDEQAAKVRRAVELLEQGWTQTTGVLNSVRKDMEEFRNSMNRIQADTLKTAQQRQTQLLESSAKAAEVWEHEVQKLREKFARIEIPPTLVREAFARVAEDLGKTAAQVIAGAASVMQGVTTKFAVIAQESEKCGAALEKLTASTASAVAASDQVKKTAETISSSIRAAGEALGTALDGGATNLAKSATAIDQHVATAGKSVAGFSQSLESAIQALGAALDGGATNLAKSATAIDQHVATAGKSVAGFSQSLQSAIQALTSMAPMLQELEKNLTETATAVAAVKGDVKTSTNALVIEVEQVGADVKQVREATGELVELARAQLTSP